ncbi:MAG: sulfatase-like hydrolase/transferase [Roseobacter sp.]
MTEGRRPNIILVVFDSLSENAMVKLGDRLPVLSSFRQNSVRFTKAYVSAPESGPARASLFTGLDMAAHGVWSDGVPLPKREITVPEVFYRNGYKTWLVGRRQLAGVADWTTEHPRAQEYHHFDWAHGPLHRSRQNAYLNWLSSKAPQAYANIFPSQANADDTRIPDAQRQAMADLPDALSFNTWVGVQFCEHLKTNATQPYCGIASFVTGQTMGAWSGNGPCMDALNKRALQQADAALGTLLERVSKDTVIVITAGRGLIGYAPMCEDALNVPLLIRSPYSTPHIVSQTVSTMDIAPTLYRLANIPAPQRIQGQCLLSAPARAWMFSRLRHPDVPQQTALSDGRWKLVSSQDQHSFGAQLQYSLYDLDEDPHENHNLALLNAHDEKLDEMIDLMIDARVALEDRTEPRIAKF